MKRFFGLAGLLSAGVSLGSIVPTAAQGTLAQPTYTNEQAQRGKDQYLKACQSCHGANLDDGEFGPPLKGPPFQAHFGDGGLDVLFDYMSSQMPQDNPGSLDPKANADVLAFILSQNGIPASSTELPTDEATLKTMAASAAN